MKTLNVIEKLRSNRLSWHGYVIRRDECHITRRALSMSFDVGVQENWRRYRWTVWKIIMYKKCKYWDAIWWSRVEDEYMASWFNVSRIRSRKKKA